MMFNFIFILIASLGWAQTSTYIKGPTLYESLVSIVSTGGTTGLTCSSMTNIELTGTSTHNFVLPDALTCNEGRVFQFKNNSTFTLTLKTFGGANLAFVVPGAHLRIVLKDNSTSVGSWFYAQSVYPVSIARDVVTDFVAGAIPFSDGLTLSQNSAAFYWDNVNEHLGIGTNAPQSALEVRGSVMPLVRINGDGASYPAPPNNTVLHTIGVNGHTSRVVFDSYNTAVNGSYLLGRHARGTAAAPTAVNSGDTLMGFAGVGYGDTDYPSNGSGYILIRANETFTDTSTATNIQVFTTPTGSLVPVKRMHIESNGGVAIGTGTPVASGKLDVQGTDGALVVPRMTTAQKNALTATNGMIVYDTTLARFECYTTAWGVCAPGKPLGEVFMFGSNTCPTGSLRADGAAISRTTYAGLFSVIGTTFGTGDGSTTFNLPNAEGIFVRGAGSQTFGSETYTGTLATKQNDATSRNGLTATSTQASHAHSPLTFFNAGPGGTSVFALGGTPLSYGAVTDSVAPTITTTVGAGDAETRPANIALRYCIVVQ